jgi:hypothetical protein
MAAEGFGFGAFAPSLEITTIGCAVIDCATGVWTFFRAGWEGSFLPSLAKRGGPHEENIPVPLKGADGVVRSTSNQSVLEPTIS